MRIRMILAIVVGVLLAGCAPHYQGSLLRCRDVPPGGVVVLADGKLHVCHETPEEVEVPSRR